MIILFLAISVNMHEADYSVRHESEECYGDRSFDYYSCEIDWSREIIENEIDHQELPEENSKEYY